MTLKLAGLQLLTLDAGSPAVIDTGDREMFVLPLSGSVGLDVATADGEPEVAFELAGRTSVFTEVSDFCYVGRDSTIRLTSTPNKMPRIGFFAFPATPKATKIGQCQR